MLDYKLISNLAESTIAESTGLFPSLKCLQEGAASSIRLGLLPVHVGDHTHATVQTGGHRQHLHVVHQCGDADALQLRQLVSTHALGQLVRSHFEKPRKQHCYTGGKTFATKTPSTILSPQIQDITLRCTW